MRRLARAIAGFVMIRPMESLETLAKYLEERGLSVTHASNVGLCVSRVDDAEIGLCVHGQGYKVERWDYVPGPGPEDFCVTVPTLDEALLVCWNYFFATPVELNGWTMPLHRYPYWSLPAMQYRLSQAVHVGQADFERICEERIARKAKEIPLSIQMPTFETAESTCFILAGTRHADGARLHVRRDMQEAYIVSG